MNASDVWLAILALFLITVVGRSAYLFAPPSWHPRGALARALGYAPLAAMVAICAPEVFRGLLRALDAGDPVGLSQIVDPRLIAALLLFVLLRVSRNEFLSLLVAGAGFAWLTA